MASLILGGYLADTLGIRAIYYTGGALLLLAALIGFGAGTQYGCCGRFAGGVHGAATGRIGRPWPWHALW